MEYFDHRTASPELVATKRVSPIRVFDLSLLPNVVMHPTLKNVTYFMIEYARALQLDMVKYPKKYKGATFKGVYERMARAIVNNDFDLRSSTPVQHACRATGVPLSYIWIQSYLWFDQPVPVQMVPRRITAADAKRLNSPDAYWKDLSRKRKNGTGVDPTRRVPRPIPVFKRTVTRKLPSWIVIPDSETNPPGDAKEVST